LNAREKLRGYQKYNKARDEKIVDIALQYNAILITSDQGIRAYASSKGVFHIYI
jgi:rRNA-processing protein FCF1